MNYQALQAELNKPAYANLADEELLSLLNDADAVEYHVTPQTCDVANYLMTTPSSTPPLTLYMKLSLTYRNNAYPDIVRAAAESAIDLANGQIQTLDLAGNPAYAQMLGALVQAGVWTQAEAVAVLDFGKRSQSIAESLGIEEVTQAHLNTIRLQPKVEQVEALRDAAIETYNTEIGRLDAMLAQLNEGIDVEVTP